jgi:hypothetical protein
VCMVLGKLNEAAVNQSCVKHAQNDAAPPSEARDLPLTVQSPLINALFSDVDYTLHRRSQAPIYDRLRGFSLHISDYPAWRAPGSVLVACLAQGLAPAQTAAAAAPASAAVVRGG